jgi:pimeloyl-ACP methyl ester carboxylesterase
MQYEIQKEGKFKYIESKGGAKNLLLLHGLFGALSNFEGIIEYFKGNYNVIVPILPIFELELPKVSLDSLVQHIIEFVNYKQYEEVNVLGNSLGGHVALLYALAQPHKVKSITLTGSSGLFENSMGNTFPARGNYEFVKTKTESTFYDPTIATPELVNEVFEIVNAREKVMAVILIAKSAIRHNLENRLSDIKAPALLVWGNQDTITPPFVGDKFHELIPNSQLIKMDKCGHAPMMEHPEQFNEYLKTFLERVN